MTFLEHLNAEADRLERDIRAARVRLVAVRSAIAAYQQDAPVPSTGGIRPAGEPCREDVANGNPPLATEGDRPLPQEPCEAGERGAEDAAGSNSAGDPPSVLDADLVDASTLDVLKASEFAVFKVIREHAGEPCSTKFLSEKTGLASIGPYVANLKAKGFIANDGYHGSTNAAYYRILVRGEPRHLVVAAGDTVLSPAPTRASKPAPASEPESEATDKNASSDYLIKTVDASTLEPLTDQEYAVWRALAELLRGTFNRFTPQEIAEKAEVSRGSIHAMLYALKKKGHAHNIGPAGAPHWLLASHGAPRLTQGRRQKDAVADPIEEPPASEPEIAPALQPAVEPEEDETFDVDDLSPRQQSVLKMIVVRRTVGQPAIDDHAVASFGIRTANDLAVVLQRLRDRGLIELSDGGWDTTALGKLFASKIFVTVPEPPKAKPPAAPRQAALPAPPAQNNDALDMVLYLERRGRDVTRLSPGLFIVDGERRRLSDVLALVNAHRRSQDLAALGDADVF